MTTPRKPRKPRDLRTEHMDCHTADLDGIGRLAWAKVDNRDLLTRDLRRLAKWCTEAAAWLDGQKGGTKR